MSAECWLNNGTSAARNQIEARTRLWVETKTRRYQEFTMANSTAQRGADAASDARNLVRLALKGALATLDRGGTNAQGGHLAGHPYASLVTVATDAEGRPLLLLSGLALHTQNLKADPRASLLIDGTSLAGDPLAGGRVTLIGRLEVTASPNARTRFLNRHPSAAQYADFGDFAFYQLNVERAHFIGGFGRIVGLSAGQMVRLIDDASALVAAEADIIAHMNQDHSDTLELYATKLAGAAPGKWHIVGCDPDGMDLLNGEHATRIPFDERITSPDASRHAMKRLADKARRMG
jgi:heme iron utilization protein